MVFPLTIKSNFFTMMSDEKLAQFSQQNKPYKFEKDSEGSLVVNEPTLFPTGEQNSDIIYQLTHWNKKYKLGRCVDSNAGFYLKDGSLRSPDAAWISNERLADLSEADLKGFPRVCPDFIIELKSKRDSIRQQKAKMKMWMSNGCRLAWLIDPANETVYVYAESGNSIHKGFDKRLTGEPVLRRFKLDLQELK